MDQFPPSWFSKFLCAWAEKQGAPHRETASDCAPPCRGLFPTVGEGKTSVKCPHASCASTLKPPPSAKTESVKCFCHWHWYGGMTYSLWPHPQRGERLSNFCSEKHPEGQAKMYWWALMREALHTYAHKCHANTAWQDGNFSFVNELPYTEPTE